MFQRPPVFFATRSTLAANGDRCASSSTRDVTMDTAESSSWSSTRLGGADNYDCHEPTGPTHDVRTLDLAGALVESP